MVEPCAQEREGVLISFISYSQIPDRAAKCITGRYHFQSGHQYEKCNDNSELVLIITKLEGLIYEEMALIKICI